MKISLIIPGKPAGKGRPRITKNGVYTPSKTRKFESLIQTVWYQSKAKAAPPDTTVFCSINAYFPLPKSASQNRQKCLLNGLYSRGKPDTDNIVKAVLDALNGLAYPDDSALFKKYGFDLEILRDLRTGGFRHDPTYAPLRESEIF